MKNFCILINCKLKMKIKIKIRLTVKLIILNKVKTLIIEFNNFFKVIYM